MPKPRQQYQFIIPLLLIIVVVQSLMLLSSKLSLHPSVPVEARDSLLKLQNDLKAGDHSDAWKARVIAMYKQGDIPVSDSITSNDGRKFLVISVAIQPHLGYGSEVDCNFLGGNCFFILEDKNGARIVANTHEGVIHLDSFDQDTINYRAYTLNFFEGNAVDEAWMTFTLNDNKSHLLGSISNNSDNQRSVVQKYYVHTYPTVFQGFGLYDVAMPSVAIVETPDASGEGATIAISVEEYVPRGGPIISPQLKYKVPKAITKWPELIRGSDEISQESTTEVQKPFTFIYGDRTFVYDYSTSKVTQR